MLNSLSMKRPLHLSSLGGTNGGNSSLEGNLCTYNLLKINVQSIVVEKKQR